MCFAFTANQILVSHNKLLHSRFLTPIKKCLSSWGTSTFAEWMQTVSMLMCVQTGPWWRWCVCVCTGWGAFWAERLRGWVCSASSHTPSTAPGVVDEFFSHAVCPPTPTPSPLGLGVCWQSSYWDGLSHAHTHWSLLVCFDQTVVLQPVSSEKLRCWCLRWLCMCVCVCPCGCERGSSLSAFIQI